VVHRRNGAEPGVSRSAFANVTGAVTTAEASLSLPGYPFHAGIVVKSAGYA
jgi:hypothetical protein